MDAKAEAIGSENARTVRSGGRIFVPNMCTHTAEERGCTFSSGTYCRGRKIKIDKPSKHDLFPSYTVRAANNRVLIRTEHPEILRESTHMVQTISRTRRNQKKLLRRLRRNQTKLFRCHGLIPSAGQRGRNDVQL